MTRAQKEKFLEDAQMLLKEYRTVGVVDMYNMPASQLADIRRSLKEFAKIKMCRKRIIAKALKIKSIDVEFKAKQPALIFGNLEPFDLFRKIKEKKSYAHAKPGIIADKDIVGHKGPTGLPPGPVMTLIQKFGGKTKIEQGKISIIDDFVIVRAGEEISNEAAELINTLGLKPVEIYLDIEFLYDQGIIFRKEALDIEPEKCIDDLKNKFLRALNLALGLEWISKRTAPILIEKAFGNAKKLALEIEFVDKITIKELLRFHVQRTKALEKAVK